MIQSKQNDVVSIQVSDNDFDGESVSSPPSKLPLSQPTARVGKNSRSFETRSVLSDDEDDSRILYSDILREVFKILPPQICPR